jgi:hypothetical protein
MDIIALQENVRCRLYIGLLTRNQTQQSSTWRLHPPIALFRRHKAATVCFWPSQHIGTLSILPFIQLDSILGTQIPRGVAPERQIAAELLSRHRKRRRIPHC